MTAITTFARLPATQIAPPQIAPPQIAPPQAAPPQAAPPQAAPPQAVPPRATGTRQPTAAGDGTELLRIVAWDDPMVDAKGVDPRSAYVETYWLPLLGPSATWLLRRLADGLEIAPHGFDLDLAETAATLGLGGVGGRRSPFRRAILRCARYAVARHVGAEVLAVRRRIPPLPDRYVLRLPLALQERHRGWVEATHRPATLVDLRRRTRSIALDLVAAEQDRASLEHHLQRWGIHPALAYESAAWAWDRHTEAAEALLAGDV